jgi:hypothetical protein
MYESGSKDRLDTEKALQDKLLANQKRHQSEYEASMKKHTEALARMKERFFGDNPAERQTKYAADLALLQEVYNAEIIAAEGNAKGYADGLNTAMDTRVTAIETWHSNFMEASEEEINKLFQA